MLKLFNLGGPSFTGVNVKIENMNVSGRTFALIIFGIHLIQIFSGSTWVDGGMHTLAIGLCLIRMVGPK